MPPYGVSFLEGMDPTEAQRPHGAVNPAAGRAQEAIRVLQLRLPRGPNFGGIAPTPLLQGPGAMGAPIGGGQLSLPSPGAAPNPLLQAIMGLAGMPGGIPGPRVTPINPNEGGPNTNPFPNAPGGTTLPQPNDPVVRPAPTPGAPTLGQKKPPQDFPLPFGGFGQVPGGFGNFY